MNTTTTNAHEGRSNPFAIGVVVIIFTCVIALFPWAWAAQNQCAKNYAAHTTK